ncbi:hypothetical protein [Bradyrhizobium sacchari]|uniref:hypothetical protein n=1 Tax=Bradyrhizobium sacchari TaxID=1399419 RepID=UPI0010A96DAF|nr:hypothetical protein [Bradyrhizobium sacchari]
MISLFSSRFRAVPSPHCRCFDALTVSTTASSNTLAAPISCEYVALTLGIAMNGSRLHKSEVLAQLAMRAVSVVKADEDILARKPAGEMA